ncbi:nucleoside triphosphate pyrophosphohydrolase [Halobacillus salinarum]|uniref:Nucleoside triphosphate pyrophosphohydrolase n=1 Tax=Halobacillus salinarum TaxID=2932257 RepID=A0ABY4EKW1_9BACI|nr:nucleoside triphosphate pyrophosphohydrolase [Halobacillus salinarum]UOQ44667.1 nucleoside triphosphate pyrophosphohydrolase [Halobacillus salinarum]
MHTITIIGLGAGELDQLPLGIYKVLQQNQDRLFVRTEEHPVLRELAEEGLTFHSFDAIYEAHSEFEAVYEQIISQLIKEAQTSGITYAVPGHPLLAERTVQLLLKAEQEGRCKLTIKGGQSFLDASFNALKIDPVEGFQCMDATSFKREEVQYLNHILFCQVYDYRVASEVKLALLEDLPADYPVTVLTAAGSKAEEILTIPLEELDRRVELNNLTSVYVPPAVKEMLNHQFFRLREVIRVLRGPDGCPWDKKQTHESLRKYLIEEAYEFIDAVDQEDDEHMVEELGDVLLQIMLHSQIGEDEGFFTIDDVILTVTDKMIRRHPHVFKDVQVDSTEEVLTNWEAIKQEEKGAAPVTLLDDVPKSFPALLQAEELQKKAAKVGFDWDNVQPVLDKVEEEWQEFEEARENQNKEEMEKEFGDWLFAIANLARHYKINGEAALQRTNRKFRTRMKAMEKAAGLQDKTLHDYDLEEMEMLWIKAKEQHKGEE